MKVDEAAWVELARAAHARLPDAVPYGQKLGVYSSIADDLGIERNTLGYYLEALRFVDQMALDDRELGALLARLPVQGVLAIARGFRRDPEHARRYLLGITDTLPSARQILADFKRRSAASDRTTLTGQFGPYFMSAAPYLFWDLDLSPYREPVVFRRASGALTNFGSSLEGRFEHDELGLPVVCILELGASDLREVVQRQAKPTLTRAVAISVFVDKVVIVLKDEGSLFDFLTHTVSLDGTNNPPKVERVVFGHGWKDDHETMVHKFAHGSPRLGTIVALTMPVRARRRT